VDQDFAPLLSAVDYKLDRHVNEKQDINARVVRHREVEVLEIVRVHIGTLYLAC
jgi:hypothetical protein